MNDLEFKLLVKDDEDDEDQDYTIYIKMDGNLKELVNNEECRKISILMIKELMEYESFSNFLQLMIEQYVFGNKEISLTFLIMNIDFEEENKFIWQYANSVISENEIKENIESFIEKFSTFLIEESIQTTKTDYDIWYENMSSKLSKCCNAEVIINKEEDVFYCSKCNDIQDYWKEPRKII